MYKRGIGTQTIVFSLIVAVGVIVTTFVLFTIFSNQNDAGLNSCLAVIDDVTLLDSRYTCYAELPNGLFVTSFSLDLASGLAGFKASLSELDGNPSEFSIEDGSLLEDVRGLTQSSTEPIAVPISGGKETYVVNGLFDHVEIYPIVPEEALCGLSDATSISSCDPEVTDILGLAFPENEDNSDEEDGPASPESPGGGGSGGGGGGGSGGGDSDDGGTQEVNEPPLIISTSLSPNGIYYSNISVVFDHDSSDEGTLGTTWEIVEDNFTTTNQTFNYTFVTPGIKTILLTVIDEEDLTNTSEIPLLVISSPGLFGFIDSPIRDELIETILVDYSAEASYVVSSDEIGEECPVVTCLAGVCPSETENSPASCSNETLLLQGELDQGYDSLFFDWTFELETISGFGIVNGSSIYNTTIGNKTVNLTLRYENVSEGIFLEANISRSFLHEPSLLFPPSASFTANVTAGVVPLIVLFNASDSFDPDGNITLYSWDFADGFGISGETLVSVPHTFESSGTFDVTLTVFDNDGLFHIADSISIVVQPDSDGDGIADDDDNCPLQQNPGQEDNDGDGEGDICDIDDDNDGDPDETDCAPFDETIYNGATEICDDGIDNDCDLQTDLADPECGAFDGDGDGVPDVSDFDPIDPFICADVDGDTCDDCSQSGFFDPANDGIDTDGDGLCDAGDPQTCGNDIIEGTEMCDGTNLGGQSCQTLGFDAGILSCTTACTFNVSACFNAPMPPSNLVASTFFPTAIALTWQDNSNDETGFLIERSLDPSFVSIDFLLQLSADTESVVDSGLTPQTTYYYRALAFNDIGNSSYSNTASNTTNPDTVLLTVTTNGTGGGTVTSGPPGIDCGIDCSELYTIASFVVLNATANGTSLFTGWSGAGCSGTGSCDLLLLENATVNAEFEEIIIAECSDGIDNDGDGFVDLADSACSDSGDNSESASVAGSFSNWDPADNYTLGSGLDLDLIVTGDSQSVVDIVFQTWNGSELRGFHTDSNGVDGWEYSSNALDQVGETLDADVQAIIRERDSGDNAIIIDILHFPTFFVTDGQGTFCGDGVVEGAEVCDGTNLTGLSCTDFGFDSGSLACSGDCLSFDTSGCFTSSECSDGSDNDGDGWTDAYDYGCTIGGTEDIVGSTQCSNQVDDDGDSFIDGFDAGCVAWQDHFESAPENEFALSVLSGSPGGWPPITGFDFTPDGQRIFYAEASTGLIKIFNLTSQDIDTFHSVSILDGPALRGLVGVVLHPDFENNGYIYYYYSAADGTNKVERITESPIGSGNAIDQTLLVQLPDAGQIHDGGRMKFGPDGSLYIATGDDDPDGNDGPIVPYWVQDVNVLSGKILRVNPITGNGYLDNPFFDDDISSAASKVYATGVRNTFGFVFHPDTGDLWAVDNGKDGNDELNLIVAGGNYGWPNVSGICDLPEEQLFCQSTGALEPVFSTNGTETIAPTGLTSISNGNSAYPSRFYGDLFFGAWVGTDLRRVTLTGVQQTEFADLVDANSLSAGGLLEFNEHPISGELYASSFNGVNESGSSGGFFKVEYEGICGNGFCDAGEDENSCSMDCTAPGTITIAIDPSRTTCIAPCGVFLDGTGTTADTAIDPFIELDYQWDYDDSSSTFTNRPEVDANSQRGPLGAHVYTQPGVYEPRLTARDVTNTSSSDSVLITVQDPNVVFAGSLTRCVSQAGDFEDCPSGAETVTSSDIESQLSWLLSTDGPRRLLLHRGETFVLNTGTGFGHRFGPLHLGAYGDGNAPVIYDNRPVDVDQVMIKFVSGITDFTVSEIRFESSYDPTTGLGSHPQAFRFRVGSDNVTIYNNSFSGLGMTIEAADVVHGFVIDNDFANWQDYGMWTGAVDYFAVVGNKIKQNESAISGAEGKCNNVACVPDFANHGPLRFSSDDKLLVSQNDMFSTTDWSSRGVTAQPTIRMGANGYSNLSVVSDNILRGGFATVSSKTSADGELARIGKILFEGNIFIGEKETRSFFDVVNGGHVIRNNLFIKLANGYPSIGTTPVAFVFPGYNYGHDPSNTNRPNYIYGNTLVSFEEDFAFFRDNDGGLENFTIANNIAYLPELNEADGAFIHWNSNEDPSELISDNNLFFAQTSIFASIDTTELTLSQWQSTYGNDQSTLLLHPLFRNIPLHCDAIELFEGTDSGTFMNIPYDVGAASQITGSANFESLGVRPDHRIRITDSDGGPGEFDCNNNNNPDSDYSQCTLAVIAVSGNVLTLDNDVLFSGSSTGVDFEYDYNPSSSSVLYLDDLTDYAINDLVVYKQDGVARTITSVGQNSTGDYIIVTPSISVEKPEGDVCEWPQGHLDFALDLNVQGSSPVIDSGLLTNRVLDDYTNSERPLGGIWDIGAYETTSSSGPGPTCSDQNGYYCEAGEVCNGEELAAADTSLCCSIPCDYDPPGGGGQTEAGWTEIIPALDTQVVYVSSSEGDDGSCQPISASDIIIADDDVFDPQIVSITPCANLQAAYNLLRDDSPDWMLLKRGDIWDNDLVGRKLGEANNYDALWRKEGRSETEKMVISAYGLETVDRPIINTKGLPGLRTGSNNPVSHFAIVSIDLDNGVDGNGYNGDHYGIFSFGDNDDWLIEDVRITGFTTNLAFVRPDSSVALNNITIKRSILVDAHQDDSFGPHAQGLYAAGVNGLVIDESVFDHNGWRNDRDDPSFHANVFNHNLYTQPWTSNAIVRNSIFSDASSHGIQLRSGGIVENNLVVRNAVGIQLGTGGVEGGGSDPTTPLSGTVTNNVVLDGLRISNQLGGGGTGISLIWVNGGGLVENNIVAHKDNGLAPVALLFSDQGPEGNHDITVADNIFYNWRGPIVFEGEAPSEFENIILRNNHVQEPTDTNLLIEHRNSNFAELDSLDNSFFRENGDASWTSEGTLEAWKVLVLDDTSLEEEIIYPEPTRDIALYMNDVIGSTGSEEELFSEFISHARDNRKGMWQEAYTATAVNDYIREGFALSLSPPEEAGSRSFFAQVTEYIETIRQFSLVGNTIRLENESASSTMITGNVVRNVFEGERVSSLIIVQFFLVLLVVLFLVQLLRIKRR